MKAYQRGILFVHGIGNQPEGATLRDFGEPLIAWIREWLSQQLGAERVGDIEVVRAELSPSRQLSDAPAHCVARVSFTTDDGRRVKQSWLMAESWWGDDVHAPAVGKFAGWLVTIGAWTIISHVTKPRGSVTTNKVARALLEAWRIAGGVVAAILFQLLVLVVSLLALLPIPAIRGALSSFLLKVSGVLGDAYVLVESDMQRAVLIERARSALRWVAKDCDAVTVVAHSQGAAIAHAALRAPNPSNVDRLLTFGSGIGKLEELMRTTTGSDRARRVARVTPIVVLVIAMLIRVAFFERYSSVTGVSSIILGVGLFGTLTWLYFTASAHWENVTPRIDALSLGAVRPNLHWIDVYASRDPVPNGPLTLNDSALPNFTSHEVVNLSSRVLDHTSYWRNQDEFLPLVVNAVEPSLFDAESREALERVSEAHRRNVRWLSITRIATGLSVALLFAIDWDGLVDRGQRIARGFAHTPDFIQSLANAIGSAVTYLLATIAGDVSRGIALALLGATLPVAGIAVWRYAYVITWRWWDRLPLRRLLKPSLYAATADRLAIDVFVIVAGFVPLVVIVALPQLAGARLVGLTVAALVIAATAMMFVLGARRLVSLARGLPPSSDPAYQGARKEVVNILLALLGFAGMTIYMLVTIVPGADGVKTFLTSIVLGAVLLGKVMSHNTELHQRVFTLTSRRWAAGLVTGAPLVASLLVIAILFATTTSTAGRGVSGFLISSFGLYLILFFVTRLAVGRVAKWRDKSSSSPREEPRDHVPPEEGLTSPSHSRVAAPVE